MYVKGVGQTRAQLLASELKIRTVGDILHYFPFRHEDRTKVYHICDIHEGMQNIQLRGRIIDFSKLGEGAKRRLMATFTDGTGFITLVWFRNLRNIERMYRMGVDYQVFGEPKIFQHGFNIAHPEMEEMETVRNRPLLRMQPVYHLTEKLTAKDLAL